MDDLNYNVAVNLKRIRREKGMSLEGMAEQTGVSKSMLAQIEKGIANPSLGVIGKIIGGLHIEFQELIEDVSPGSRLVHIKEMEPTKEVRGEYKIWNCFPYENNCVAKIYRIDMGTGVRIYRQQSGEKDKSIHFCAGRRSKDPVRRGSIPGRKRGCVLPGDGPAAQLP